MAVLWTNPANCRDCYACVRACPVKAIRVSVSHAEVVEELCILDGSCVAACPQGAKQIESHIARVEAKLSQGQTVFSLAPSISAAFDIHPGVVAAALRRVGALAVAETSETTEWVSRRHWELAESQDSVISSCCPAVVNLVTHYYPGALPHLAEVASPMVAHGRAIKAALGPETQVAFVGPCIAKKAEMREPDSAVDGALTFAELQDLLDRNVPGWRELAPEPFDSFVVPEGGEIGARQRRQFPLPGGMLPLLGAPLDLAQGDIIVATGVRQCAELLASIPTHGLPARLVELMACEHGCIVGPGMADNEPGFRRVQRVQAYATAPLLAGTPRAALQYGDVDLGRSFKDCRPHLPEPTEEEVRAILASIGKRQPSDELDCGACGYESCRAKAVAVFRGLAEREMCIPYMRSKAESLAEATIATTPTGIIVINPSLHVLALNPSAERLFDCSASDYVGRPLWRLCDPARVERVFSTQKPLAGVVRLEKQGKVVREYLVYDEKNDLVIAFLGDITEETRRREEFARLKETSLERAQEVIDQQMRVAQEIAGLLGETTAETKAILTKLMRLFHESEGVL